MGRDVCEVRELRCLPHPRWASSSETEQLLSPQSPPLRLAPPLCRSPPRQAGLQPSALWGGAYTRPAVGSPLPLLTHPLVLASCTRVQPEVAPRGLPDLLRSGGAARACVASAAQPRADADRSRPTAAQQQCALRQSTTP